MEARNKAGSSMESATMKSLTTAQEATGKAYISVQGGLSSNAAANAVASMAKAKAKVDKVDKKKKKQ